MTNEAVENSLEPAPVQRIGIRKSSGLVLAFWLGLMPLKTHAAHTTTAPDCDSFLKAVAEVETGGNPRAVGGQGERGLYQFTLATWRAYTTQPFIAAHDPVIAHEVAVKHFVWLQDRMLASGRQPTAHHLAVAWNSGLSRALTGRFPQSTRDYASRVVNLTGAYARSLPQKSARPVTAVAANVTLPPSASVADPGFRLGDVFVDSAHDAPEVVPAAEVAMDVTFNLSPSRGSSSADPKSEPRRRFIFATVGK